MSEWGRRSRRTRGRYGEGFRHAKRGYLTYLRLHVGPPFFERVMVHSCCRTEKLFA